ncbi:unnamed protein product [Cuscuta epithymum]|uniref:Uncharacterized protein n=1 Tax=Cuscuta epithymum TaxID=186058 RepID=A0AAV0EYT6_9ASTE|nr:unnamed protein product [Cuscuta epithymum]
MRPHYPRLNPNSLPHHFRLPKTRSIDLKSAKKNGEGNATELAEVGAASESGDGWWRRQSSNDAACAEKDLRRIWERKTVIWEKKRSFVRSSAQQLWWSSEMSDIGEDFVPFPQSKDGTQRSDLGEDFVERRGARVARFGASWNTFLEKNQNVYIFRNEKLDSHTPAIISNIIFIFVLNFNLKERTINYIYLNRNTPYMKYMCE